MFKEYTKMFKSAFFLTIGVYVFFALLIVAGVVWYMGGTHQDLNKMEEATTTMATSVCRSRHPATNVGYYDPEYPTQVKCTVVTNGITTTENVSLVEGACK